MLIHRCRKRGCGHRDDLHNKEGGDCSYGLCKPCRLPDSLDVEPMPELVPTWDTKGNLVERVHKPGSTWNEGNRHAIKLCNCERCNAAYDEAVIERTTQNAARAAAPKPPAKKAAAKKAATKSTRPAPRRRGTTKEKA